MMTKCARVDNLFRRGEPAVARRGIHFDLKGLPPTATRFMELLRCAAVARFNVVLVEWEDMFPWRCDTRLQGPTAYSPEDVRNFCREAEALGLELIPLVQTLGHMETVLRLPGRESLRELPHDPYTINPLADGAAGLVRAMIRDVLDGMPGLRHFHLGADEAWSMGLHPQTRAYMAEHGKAGLFRHHLDPLLGEVIARGVRPVLWHDMFIDLPQTDLAALGRQADLMVWGYGVHPDVTDLHYNTKYIRRFHDAGVPLWGATACKGAGGFSSDLPDLRARGENAAHWMDIHTRFGLAGIVSTAWSRYSTDNLQCEPMDAALDSMLYSGIILHDGAAPEGGVEACREAAGCLPGGTAFAACRAVMERMARLRTAGWAAAQMLHEHVTLAEHDARRRATLPCSSLRDMRRVVQDAAMLEQDIHRAFAGLIAPCWIESYCTERLAPLRDICRAFEPRVRAIVPPAVWDFEEVNHHRPLLERAAAGAGT